MEYRRLGRSDLNVSPICLGSMTWGEQNSDAEAFEQPDYAIDQGVNFIDTAEMYPIDTRAETYGRTEEIIGNWMATRGTRGQVVVATKIVGPNAQRFPYIRGGETHVERKPLEAAVEERLQRLETDNINIYQIPWPARATHEFARPAQRQPRKSDA